MKSPELKQSKIHIKTSSYRSDLLDDQMQIDNPQNNFEKLMTMPEDIPSRQLKHIIQSMSEHCSFQKNLMKKTYGIQVPNHVKSQISRVQVYKDYVAIKDYANFLKQKKHFEGRKFCTTSKKFSKSKQVQQQNSLKTARSKRKSAMNTPKNKQLSNSFVATSKPYSLLQFVQQKKKSMIMEDNILKIQQHKINSILNDTKKKQKIFEEALFLQRLYDIQIQKLKSVGVSENTHQVPQKFRGVQPKHIRITSQTSANQQQYLRKKYVCKKRKLQFYGHARKIQQSSLKTKKLQNLAVLSTIINFNEANYLSDYSNSNTQGKTSQSGPKDIITYQQDLKIKRLFLKYSCCQAENPQQMYKYLSQKELDQFFIDFNLQQKKITNPELNFFLQKKREQSLKLNKDSMHKQSKIKFFLFDFLQIIYILSSEGSQQKFRCNISDFLNQKIWPKQNKVMPQLWIKLKKLKKSQKITKYIKILKIQQKCKMLFQKKAKPISVSQYSMRLLSFSQIMQIAWQLKLFPLTVPKKSLRFIYLYCKSHENGVTQQDFVNMILIICLQFAPYEQIQQKIKWIATQISK